jgi:hypothetical protein
MTNDEIPNDEGMSKSEAQNPKQIQNTKIPMTKTMIADLRFFSSLGMSSFVIYSSLGISSFVIHQRLPSG